MLPAHVAFIHPFWFLSSFLLPVPAFLARSHPVHFPIVFLWHISCISQHPFAEDHCISHSSYLPIDIPSDVTQEDFVTRPKSTDCAWACCSVASRLSSIQPHNVCLHDDHVAVFYHCCQTECEFHRFQWEWQNGKSIKSPYEYQLMELCVLDHPFWRLLSTKEENWQIC